MTAHTRRTATELQILCCMARPGAPNQAAGEAALTAYVGGLNVEQVDELEALICEDWAALSPDVMHAGLTDLLRVRHSER